METIIYPVITSEKRLPFYVTCIGENENQCHINRKNGFFNSQIIFCTKGRGTLKTELFNCEIAAGDVFFLPADSPHEYKPVGKIWFTHYISFDGYVSDLVLREFGLTEPRVFHVNTDTLEHIFRKILFTLKSDRAYGGYTASALVYELVIELNRLSDSERQTDSKCEAVLNPVIEYINANYEKEIELSYLCELSGVTPQYLCRLFKSNLGLRPLEYITGLRIQRAKQLLIDNKLTVKEVAAAVGYSATSYFSSVFRKYEGMSPTEFVLKH